MGEIGRAIPAAQRSVNARGETPAQEKDRLLSESRVADFISTMLEHQCPTTDFYDVSGQFWREVHVSRDKLIGAGWVVISDDNRSRDVDPEGWIVMPNGVTHYSTPYQTSNGMDGLRQGQQYVTTPQQPRIGGGGGCEELQEVRAPYGNDNNYRRLLWFTEKQLELPSGSLVNEILSERLNSSWPLLP